MRYMSDILRAFRRDANDLNFIYYLSCKYPWAFKRRVHYERMNVRGGYGVDVEYMCACVCVCVCV